MHSNTAKRFCSIWCDSSPAQRCPVKQSYELGKRASDMLALLYCTSYFDMISILYLNISSSLFLFRGRKTMMMFFALTASSDTAAAAELVY